MNRTTNTGLEILASAAAVGLAGNFLLRQTPWGLNAFLFVTIFVAAFAVIMLRRRRELLSWRTASVMGAMIFFSSMYLVRDAVELLIYDTLAIIVLMGVLILPNFGVNQRIAGVIHYVGGLLWAGIGSFFSGFVLLGADIEWGSMPSGRLSKSIFGVLRGVAIALPLVLVFGGLFMAADAAYENFADRLITFDLDIVLSHVLLTSVLAWLTAGYLRTALVAPFAARAAGLSITPRQEAEPAASSSSASSAASKAVSGGVVTKLADDTESEPGPLPDNASAFEHLNRSDPPNSAAPSDDVRPEAEGPTVAEEQTRQRDWQNFDNSVMGTVFTLGRVETLVVLGLLDALFLSFVIFQVPYLFGGMELVQTTPDLKLADFARRGFGELVTVSFLVLPLLLATHWLIRRDERGAMPLFKWLAGIQIVLLGVIMVSAMQRLLLLTGELGYGWTTVRFYPMVVMFWLASVFVWFAWTVLRGRRGSFAWGALWLAIFALGATNLWNPHAFIAERNIELMKQGRDFDAHYNANLSDDAIPALIKGLPSMSTGDRCSAGSAIHYRYRELGQITDLRSFSLSRRTAFYELRANDALLHDTADCSPAYSNDTAFGSEEDH